MERHIKKETKEKRFSYSKWACDVAASCLSSDLDCGFEITNTTPDRGKALAAMRKLIAQLRKRSK